MTDTTAAEAYERGLVPHIFAPWTKLVLDEAGLRSGQRVLDLACGTGIAARLAAAQVGAGGAVTGADIDAAMLAVARRAPPGEGAAAIDWQRADAQALPFADAGFDTVLCFEGMQFVPDRAKALRECRRVLWPGGRMIGTIWGPLEANPGYDALAAGLGKFVSPEAARLPPFQLHDAAEIHALLSGAGFTDVEVTPRNLALPVASAAEFVQWVAAGAPTTRHKLAMLNPGDRDAFGRFVEERLEPYRHGGVLQIPFMRHVFTARC
jgi:SAM-dependent methyltransferase